METIMITKEEYKALVEDSVILKNVETFLLKQQRDYADIETIKSIIGLEE